MHAPPPLRQPGSSGASRLSGRRSRPRKRFSEVSNTACRPPRTKSPRDGRVHDEGEMVGQEVLRQAVAFDAGEGREPADGAVGVGVEQREDRRRRAVGTAPGWATGCRCPPGWRGAHRGGRRWRAELEPAASASRRGRRSGRGGRAALRSASATRTRAEVTAFAERDQPGRAGVHVATGVAESERRDREVGQEVDARRAEPAASRRGTPPRRGSAAVVWSRRPCRLDPGPAAGDGGCEAERLFVCSLSDVSGRASSASGRRRRRPRPARPPGGPGPRQSARRGQPGGASRRARPGSGRPRWVVRWAIPSRTHSRARAPPPPARSRAATAGSGGFTRTAKRGEKTTAARWTVMLIAPPPQSHAW